MKTTSKKITKITSLILSIAMIFGILACAPFTASAATYDDYEYDVTDDGYAFITKYTGNSSSVKIPSEINGYPVFGIGENAFYKNQLIKTLKIPEGVILIDSGAFAYCKNLKSITMADTVVVVGGGAFAETAYSKSSANWENDVLYVGKVAISVKEDVTRVSIKPGTLGIANRAAIGCENLTYFTIPDSVIVIGSEVGLNCVRLKEITLPYNLQIIGQCAFGYNEFEYYYFKVENFKVIGAKGTIAEEYAKAFGFTFVNSTIAKSISFSKTKFTLGVGESYTIIKNITPSSAANYTWSSSNTSVASVSQDGTVKAKKAGTATIKLTTASGLSKSAKVTVKKAPSSIKLNKSSFTLGVGESYVMSESVNSGAFVNNPNLTWSSSDKNVITVSKQSGGKCKVTAVGTGTATVTIKTYNGKTDKCTVTVKEAPSEIKVNKTAFTLGVGESYTMKSTINSEAFANAHSLTWTSSNKKVATVKKLGGGKCTVTAVGTGTTTITVKTYNGLTATCKVTVKKAPSKIKLNKSSFKLGIGEDYVMTSTIGSDEFLNHHSISWTSSNNKVATVTKMAGGKAKVVAKGTGTTTITVKTYNGKTAKCKVTVYKAPSSIKLNKTAFTLGVGESYTMSQSVNSGAFVNNPNLTWSSSDSNIVSVKKKGNKAEVTATGVGTAIITVKTYNGKTASCKVTVKEAPSEITLNKTSLALTKGKDYVLQQTINSEAFINTHSLSWTSSDKNVVTVKKMGGGKAQLVAKGKGTATVTVKTYNGLTATCEVTVK